MALACAALALLGLLAHPAPAAAQVVTTFISNTGQTTTFTSDLVQAVAFTTGTSTYELSSVGIYLGSQTGDITRSVEIYGDSGGNPGTNPVAFLTNPESFADNAVHTFTPSIPITLSASTTYWVVTRNLAAADGQGFRVGLTNKTLDTGTAVGWSLGDALSKDDIDDDLWTASNRPLRFEIRGTGGMTATGRPTITGTAQVGQTLTAVTTAIMDADGLENVNYMYQWIRGSTVIDGATARTYTLVAADQDTRIKVRVSFTDDAGYREALTSVTTATVTAAPNTPATGRPTITGTAQVGQTLTAGTTGIMDADGLTSVSYAYQWIRVAPDNSDTDIGAMTGTYTLVADDLGTTIKVKVSFTDDAKYSETLTSAATATVTAANTPATGAPTITGTAQVGQTLTATVGDIVDVDGLPDPFLTDTNTSFQWIRVAPDNTETNISGPTPSTYTLVTDDQGMTIKVTVSFTDDAGYPETLTSEATAIVAAAANTPATGAPTITGTAQVGQTLTATVGDIVDVDGLPDPFLTDTNTSFQWIRVTTDNTDTNISGPTPSTYTLVADDQGMTIKVTVSFTDDAGYPETLTSEATAIVAAAANTPATGAPTITGTAQVGQTLTATVGDIVDVDGLPDPFLTDTNTSFQWIRVTTDNTDTNISGPTPSTYTLVADDQGMTIKVTVSFTDDAGYPETLTSEATAIVAAAANTPATGAPTITGTAQVGQTLTATVGDIVDVDGLPDPFLTDTNTSFQWIRVTTDNTDTNISGPTPSTYTLVADDQGMTIKVTVSFTDDAGYPETLTSEATAIVAAAANTPATGAPTITGTAQVGQTLTATVGDIVDVDGLPDPFLTDTNTSFQWIRVTTDNTDTNISGPTPSTYTLVADDQGMTIKVTVSFTDDAGYPETLTSEATAIVAAAANTPATGAPTITGTAQVGQTLTATVGDIVDVDGLPDPFLTDTNTSFQWIRVTTDNTDTNISGPTPSTYTLVADDQGMTIKVTVSFTDDAGYPETLTSEATAIVAAAANTPATGAPTITGTAQVGQTLTATVGDIVDVDGLPDPFLTDTNTSFQWIRVTTDNTDTNISEATASTYTLVADDQGMTIKVTVSFTDDAGYPETLTSEATAIVTAAANTPATGAPTITGTAQVGQTLTATVGDIVDVDGLPDPFLTDTNTSFQWIRVTTDNTDTNISGPTPSTYTLVADDQGMTIKVTVSFTDDAGYPETLTSEATAIVTAAANTPATGAPTITGTAQVGQTLTATVGDIVDVDGLPDPFLTDTNTSFQWIRVTTDNTDTPISEATASTYTLMAADQDTMIKVTVSFTDDAGNAEARTSAATAIVTAADNTPATGAPTITGTAQVGQTLTADTAAIVDADRLTTPGYTYQWIRVAPDPTTETNISEATASTYTLMAADQDTMIKVTVSFTDDAGNPETLTSTATATVTTAVSTPATGAPTITGTAQVGQTLTAGTTAIMDANGLTNVRYTYQWIRVDDNTEANISGATASTYTLVAADEGTTIKVTVSFTDDASNAETLTSAATAAATITLVAPSTVRAWTSRFGRTVATHVTDAVGERLRQSPEQDSQVTVGGYRLPLGRHAAGGADPDATEPETTTDRLASLLTGLAGRVLGLAAPQGGDGTDPRLGQSQPLQPPTIRLRDVLLGSSFRLALGDDDAAPGDMRLTAWGRVAGTQFSGRDGALTLDGNVLTGTVGVDSAWDRWLTGVAVSHSLGGGSFTGDRAGDFDSSTLTSVHPYLRYAVNERVDVWSVLGYGRGDLTLEPGTGGTLETDTTLLMGAFGGRGILLSAPDNAGFQLATRTDAMLTRMTSGAVGGLAATDAEAHRLRLVLEGTRDVTWPEGQRVTPTVELGVRHDWGDAETGFGLELGGRVQYADPGHGLTIEVAVRGLLAHEDSDYKEWGASGTIRIDPGPTGQGLSLTLAPTWGAASSGIESLWARQTTAGLAPQGTRSAPTGRLNAEVSYGVAAPFGTGLLTPYVGTVLTDGAARTYRVGTRLELTGGWTTGVTLSLEGQRQEPVGPQPIYQGLQFQAAWGF